MFWTAVSISSLVLVLLLSYILSRMIRKPLTEMTDVTALITDSVDLSKYVTYRSKNELGRSEEHTSELQSRGHLVCRLLLEKQKQDLHLPLPSNRNTTTLLHT